MWTVCWVAMDIDLSELNGCTDSINETSVLCQWIVHRPPATYASCLLLCPFLWLTPPQWVSLANQQASFGRLQAVWCWFPWGPSRWLAALESPFADNLVCTTLVMWAMDLEVIRQGCRPMRRPVDTVPAPFSAPLLEICCVTAEWWAGQSLISKMMCSDAELCKYLCVAKSQPSATDLKWLNYFFFLKFDWPTPSGSEIPAHQLHHSNHIHTRDHWSSEMWVKWLHLMN